MTERWRFNALDKFVPDTQTHRQSDSLGSLTEPKKNRLVIYRYMKLRKQNRSSHEISVDNFGVWPGKLSQREDLTTVQTSNWDKLVFPAPGWLIPLRTNVAVGILIANHKITVYTHPPTSPQCSHMTPPLNQIKTWHWNAGGGDRNGEKMEPTPIIV